MADGGRIVGRREFLAGSLAAAGLLTGCTASGPQAWTSASGGSPSATTHPSTPASSPESPRVTQVTVAIIGAGGHGTRLAKRFARNRRVRILSVCDPDSARADELADQVLDICGPRPCVHADLRHVLDDRRIEVVVVATPHHWHALAAVWALEAGKHLYLEKPATHCLAEGTAVLAAWRDSGLVVEVGTQRRSHPGLREAIADLHAGAIGAVDLARCYSWKRRPPIGPEMRGSWPRSLDADLWFGPRDVERPTRQQFHYDWHWFTDYGNGGLGNNGVHRLDVARWGMGLTGIGSQVLSVGARLGPDDAGQTPNTALTVVAFGDRAVTHDLRGLPTAPMRGMQPSDEVAFIGQEGSIVVNRTGGRLVDPEGRTVRTYGSDAGEVDPITRHIKGFLRAVLDGDPGAVAVGPVEGVGAAAMCHSAAATLASVARGSGRVGDEEVIDDVVSICGEGMETAVRDFLAHCRAHAGRGELAHSGWRSIIGTRVEGADADVEYRTGFELPRRAPRVGHPQL